jgi:SecD/SecF fusion protein
MQRILFLTQALQQAKLDRVNSDADFITLFAQAYKKLNPNGKLSTLFAGAAQKNIKLEDSDAQVVDKIRTAATGAINNTYNVLQAY